MKSKLIFCLFFTLFFPKKCCAVDFKNINKKNIIAIASTALTVQYAPDNLINSISNQLINLYIIALIPLTNGWILDHENNFQNARVGLNNNYKLTLESLIRTALGFSAGILSLCL